MNKRKDNMNEKVIGYQIYNVPKHQKKLKKSSIGLPRDSVSIYEIKGF